MIEIQQKISLANLVIDHLYKEKPFYLTMSEKQFEMFLSMVEASGLDIGFSIKNMANLVRIEFDERNADRVYHALSSFINEHELPETVVKSLKEVS
ncbi:hypothetical protein [Acinetobacter thermotolerans]|uniref:hypothetical protein n=1 Tax=Acinetobacter thermotolerans TaxID=3151487 RepID=UPI00325B3A39